MLLRRTSVCRLLRFSKSPDKVSLLRFFRRAHTLVETGDIRTIDSQTSSPAVNTHTSLSSSLPPFLNQVNTKKALVVNTITKTKLRKLQIVKSVGEVFDILEDPHLPKTLSRTDVTVALHRLGKYVTPENILSTITNHWFSELQKCFLQMKHVHEERDLSNVAWSLAQFAQKAVSSAVASSSSSSGRTPSNSDSQNSTLLLLQHRTLDILLPCIQERALEVHSSFTALGLTNLVWALAKIRNIVHASSTTASSAINATNIFSSASNAIAAGFSALSPSSTISSGLVSHLLRAAESKLKDFNPQLISNLMYALATIHFTPLPPSFVKNMLSQAVVVEEKFDSQNISNLIWALITLDLLPVPNTQEKLSSSAPSSSNVETKISSSIQDNEQALSLSITMTENEQETFLKSMINASLKQAPSFSPQELSNLFWSFASIHDRCPNSSIFSFPSFSTLVSALVQTATEKSSQFNPQAISTLFWALASLHITPSTALLRALSRVAHTTINQFFPREMSSLLWGFATLKIQPSEQLISAMSEQLVNRRQELEPQSLSNLFWSFATLGITPSNDLIQTVTDASISTSDFFSPQSISNLLWSFASLKIVPSQTLVDALSEKAISTIKEFSPQSLANTISAFASLKLTSPPLIEAVMRETMSKISFFDPRYVSIVARSLASLLITPSQRFVDVMCARALDLKKDLLPQNVSNFLWVLSEWNVSPSTELLEVMSAIAVEKMTDFTPGGMTELAVAMSRFQLTDTELIHALTRAAIEKHQQFEISEASLLMRHLSILAGNNDIDPELVRLMSLQAVLKRKDLTPEDMSSLLRAFGPQGDIELVQAISSEAALRSESFPPWVACRLLDGFARAARRPDESLVQKLLDQLVNKRDELMLADYVSALQRLHQIGVAPSSCFVKTMSKWIVGKQRDFDSQTLVGYFSALVGLNLLKDSADLSALFRRVIQLRDQFQPNEIIQLFRVILSGKLELDPGFVRALSNQSARTVSQFEFNQMIDLLVLFAKCDILSAAVIQAFSDEFVARRQDFSPLEILAVFSTFQQLRLEPELRLVRALTDISIKLADQFSDEQSFVLMRLFATLGLIPDRTLMRLMSKGLSWERKPR